MIFLKWRQADKYEDDKSQSMLTAKANVWKKLKDI